MGQFSITLKKLAEDVRLEVLYSPAPLEEIHIHSADVNRPGLLLAGYDKYFDKERIQILGNAEKGYLATLPLEEQIARAERLFSCHPPVLVYSRGLPVGDFVLDVAKKYQVPVLRSRENTSLLVNNLVSVLSVALAPRITRHGVMVEVYGEGIFITGDSGVGKSETAIELLKRGHRLIADDAVELRRVSDRSIVGSSPENIRHFIELRGVGILNVARTFGTGAVKVSEKVDMVVHLEHWDPEKHYQDLGLRPETTEIMGLEIPMVVLPVKPGRNLAIVIEAAAINNRQRKMGYSAASDLMQRLGFGDPTSQG
ncbi:MAG TPA: HPr(Ser) kinase/phosphatase [Candidatus Anaerofilum excrementigallinarum]|nr:HPr(Ser) kinase/phosphatase [Candidatus Anaerofilum excrementigallinarum]